MFVFYNWVFIIGYLTEMRRLDITTGAKDRQQLTIDKKG